MMATFDKTYWEARWTPGGGLPAGPPAVHPYLAPETAGLTPTTALDAGCGAGTEALWLAEQGWQVTAVDISSTAVSAARARGLEAGLGERIEWVEADLSDWDPPRTWDLVVTSYAHSALGQLAFYQRIAGCVAPGGTLLIVGHLHGAGPHGTGHPQDATATQAGITGLFAGPEWDVMASYENSRTLQHGGQRGQLRDVVVRALRVRDVGG